jgi:hypothetical protein
MTNVGIGEPWITLWSLRSLSARSFSGLPGLFSACAKFAGLLRCCSALSMSGPRFVRFMAMGLREEHGIE